MTQEKQERRSSQDRILHENKMPGFLKNPTDPKGIQLGRERPMSHPLIVRSRPLPNAFPGQRKLRTAYITNMGRHMLHGDVEKLHVHVEEVRPDIIVLDVDIRWFERVDRNRTARIQVAAQIHVTFGPHSVQAQDREDVGI